MRRTKIVLVFLVVISTIMGTGLETYAQPNIPKEKISWHISNEIRILIEALYSSDPMERGSAAHDFGRIDKRAEPSIPFLIGILGHASALGRTPDNYYLGLFETTPGIPAAPGEEAANALVKIKGGGVLEPLKAAIKDKDSRVRYSAVCGLGEMSESGAETLIGALRDWDVRVQEEAAWVLGDIKHARAVGLLIAALRDENRDVQKYTEETLEAITGKSLGQDPVKWEEWREQNNRSFLKTEKRSVESKASWQGCHRFL